MGNGIWLPFTVMVEGAYINPDMNFCWWLGLQLGLGCSTVIPNCYVWGPIASDFHGLPVANWRSFGKLAVLTSKRQHMRPCVAAGCSFCPFIVDTCGYLCTSASGILCIIATEWAFRLGKALLLWEDAAWMWRFKEESPNKCFLPYLHLLLHPRN